MVFEQLYSSQRQSPQIPKRSMNYQNRLTQHLGSFLIAVQSSFNLGSLGIKDAYDGAFNGKTIPISIDTGFLMVTKANIDSADAMNVLY